MNELQAIIEDAWEKRTEITPKTTGKLRDAVEEVLASLDKGALRAALLKVRRVVE